MLALLPTASENIIKALPVEDILGELQARKTEKMTRSGQMSTASSEFAPSEMGTEEGSVGTGSFVHASQQIPRSDGAQTSQEGDTRAARRDGLSGKSKVLLWEDLKITCTPPLPPSRTAPANADHAIPTAITRALTLIYTLPLLTLLTRIQLNLLGRRTYLSSVVALAAPPATLGPSQAAADDLSGEAPPIALENNDDDRTDYYGADLETNRKYLTFSWWLLHTGWVSIKNEVEMAVREVFGSLNPRDSISLEQLAELILSVRRTVEGRDEDERREKRWLGFLLPPRDQEEHVLRESGMLFSSTPSPDSQPQSPLGNEAITPSLRRLIDETSDIIDSPPFSHVLTLLLDAAFSLLIDDKVVKEAYKMPSQGDRLAASASTYPIPESRVVDVTDSDAALAGPTAKLATILAVLTRQAHAIGRGGEESIQAIETASTAGASSGFPRVTGQIDGLASANDYLATLSAVQDLEAFAAVVYSSNFEFEGLNEDGADDVDNGVVAGLLPATPGDIDASLVDVGAEVEGSMESAWGKALEASDRGGR